MCDPAAMGGVEHVASKAVLENPPQPVGAAPPRPTPPPPPPPPLNSNLGGRVVPNQDIEVSAAAAAAVVGDRQIDEAPTAQEGGFASRTSGSGQALNLSDELVPIAAAGEVPQDDTPNYHDWQNLFPELKVLVDGLSEIAAECAQVAAWKAWPEKHYDEGGGQDWKVLFGRMGYKRSRLGLACQFPVARPMIGICCTYFNEGEDVASAYRVRSIRGAATTVGGLLPLRCGVVQRLRV